jgi:hypothetical protein
LLLLVLGAHNVDAGVLANGEGVSEDDKNFVELSGTCKLCEDLYLA